MLLSFLAAICVAPGARAAVVEALYEASVPVDDQSDAARNRAFRAAFGAVLVKNTGRRGIVRSAVVADLVDSAPRLVQQFRYERVDTIDAATGEPVEELRLWVRFDGTAVIRALAERGIPLWGRERPATLVWLAYDDGLERSVVDDSARSVYHESIRDAARARGMPILFPLMDLNDRSALPFAELWGGFDERVIRASARYDANAILVGRLFRADRERWAARWTLLEGGWSVTMETAPGPLAAVVADGIHRVADSFAERFALVPDEVRDGRMRLTVVGVSSIGDYAGVMRYLRELSPIADIEVDSVVADEVTFALELRGNRVQLEQAIALDSRLVPAPAGFGTDPFGLRYSYTRR